MKSISSRHERDKWEFSDFMLSLTKKVEERMREREKKKSFNRDKERETVRVIEKWVVRNSVLT